MASNPTKILLYDLDADLGKLMDSLKQFQGSYASIYDRLMHLGTDTFTDDVKKVADDLISGYQNGSVLTIQRIENLKNELEALKNRSPLSESPKHEEFAYDEEQDVQTVTAYDKADTATRLKLHETSYEYGDVNASKEIVKSITRIYDTDGTTLKETITKVYGYDDNNNVKSITTTVA